jgi:hypothetical protein
MTHRHHFFVLLCTGLLAVAHSSESIQSTREKLHRVITDRLEIGELVIFSELEINSLLAYRPLVKIPPGLSNLTVTILVGRTIIDADIDFETVKMNSKFTPGLLIDLLLRGEHTLRLYCDAHANDGVGLIRITSLDIDNTPLQGPLLEWFVDEFLADQIPAVHFNEPFSLPRNLDAIHLETGRIMVMRF